MDTVTVLVLPGALPVDLVATASLEDGEIYYIENTGLGRCILVEATEQPDRNTKIGHSVIPRGIMSVRTIQPDGERGIWAWNDEDLGAQLTISRVPE